MNKKILLILGVNLYKNSNCENPQVIQQQISNTHILNQPHYISIGDYMKNNKFFCFSIFFIQYVLGIVFVFLFFPLSLLWFPLTIYLFYHMGFPEKKLPQHVVLISNQTSQIPIK